METNNKLREALKMCVDELCARCRDLAKAQGDPMPCLNGCEPVRKAKAALAAPVRNCDVGTAEEQSKRLHDYCKSHRCLNCSSGNGDECKFYRPGMKTDCKIEWANAPYESEVAK